LFILREERSHDREEDSDGTYHERNSGKTVMSYGSWDDSGPIAGLINIQQTIKAVVKVGRMLLFSIRDWLKRVTWVEEGMWD
jgi:hypothetical protein